MKKTQLQFSDTQTLSEFILKYEPSKAEVNSISCSLTADMDDRQIAIACSGFNALLQKTVSPGLHDNSSTPTVFMPEASMGDCKPDFSFQ